MYYISRIALPVGVTTLQFCNFLLEKFRFVKRVYPLPLPATIKKILLAFSEFYLTLDKGIICK